jgi:hypothetical protein
VVLLVVFVYCCTAEKRNKRPPAPVDQLDSVDAGDEDKKKKYKNQFGKLFGSPNFGGRPS